MAPTKKQAKPLEDVGSLWALEGISDSYLLPNLMDVCCVFHQADLLGCGRKDAVDALLKCCNQERAQQRCREFTLKLWDLPAFGVFSSV